MKHGFLRCLALGLLLSGLVGCAELEDADETGLGFHPADWATPGSDDNHAANLMDRGLPNAVQTDCSGCHGADFGKPDSDCFACHATGAGVGHPASGFVGPSGADFHGAMVIQEGGTDRCGECHAWEEAGELDFNLGGWSQQACNVCHAGGRSGHPASSDWFNSSSPDFHGTAAARGMITDCAQCHGADYLGGWTDVSCSDCHGSSSLDIHFDGWVGASTTDGTHGYLITHGEIAMSDCAACHGATWDGGWTGQTCMPCHAF